MKSRRAAAPPVLGAAALLSYSACGPAAASDPVAGDGARCPVRLAPTAPQFAAPKPVSTPVSDIAVTVRAPLVAVERELSRHVPVVLASERDQPIGAPGQVSYTVRRGGLATSLREDRLMVTTTVSVSVEVCKPLGPFCPVYGRCQPQLVANASVPLLLTDDYRLPNSAVGISVTRGCVIAGIDAGPEIRKIAGREAGAVQRRIDRALPNPRPWVVAGWQLLHTPVSLGRSTCLSITPQRVVQSGPGLDGKEISLRLAVSGQLSVTDPCTDPEPPATVPPLPPLDRAAAAPERVHLRIPLRIGWSAVSTELGRSLAAGTANDGLRIVHTRARGAVVAGKPRIALVVTLAGNACGDAHFVTSAAYDEADARLHLVDVRPAPGFDSRDVDLEALTRSIARHARIALPIDAAGAPASLATMVENLTRDVPEPLQARVSLNAARVEPVLLDAESLVPIVSVDGEARVRVK